MKPPLQDALAQEARLIEMSQTRDCRDCALRAKKSGRPRVVNWMRIDHSVEWKWLLADRHQGKVLHEVRDAVSGQGLVCSANSECQTAHERSDALGQQCRYASDRALFYFDQHHCDRRSTRQAPTPV